MTAAQRERAALVETMRTVGPNAPTLCGDWTTRDLAAHLVVREGRLDATAGVAVGHGPELIVTGELEELVLFLSGRDEVRLTFSDAQAAQAVRAARRGL